MRTHFKFILSLMALLMLPVFITGSEYDWQQVRDEDGIKVYLKKYWADEIKSFRGVTQISASVASLLAVIIDIDACSDWVHRCKNSLLLLRKSFSECYHYQVHKLPFPARNREFIFHSTIIRSHKTRSVSIHMNVEPEFCADNSNSACSLISNTSLVRVKHSHGYYLLEPLQENLTRVTWTHHTNPEGKLPIWLINRLIREMPFRTLQGLRKKVSEDKYQKAKLIIDTHGKMVDLVIHN